VLLAADYFLTSYALYGLAPPPPGYVWVRDGTDAVLVDRYTGQVIQVQEDVFY
jgi:Ni/Co efflux regulator RcnB